MTELTMKIGRRTASLVPSGNLTPVDFALGVVNGEAYVGYWEDMDIIDDSGNFIDTETIPVMVFKDAKIVYDKDSLRSLNMKRASMPVVQENWWSGKVVGVEPKKYYEDVLNEFRYYIDAPEKNLHFMSLWTIGTIFHILFNAYAYMHLHGVSRSGKTKVLTLTKLMGFNGIRSHSMSEATIYRLVESGKATLLLDEQDYLSDPERRAEFRTLLLGGYKKGSYVYRSEKTSKGKIIPVRFRIYSPKAMANIEGLENVLMDRTVTITMMRSTDPEITRREPDEEDPKWEAMRDRLASLFLHFHSEVKTAYSDVLKSLGDHPDLSGVSDDLKPVFLNAREFIYSRVREIWSPILALALFFERHGVDGLVEKVVELARENVAEREVDEVEIPEVGLITAMCRIYNGNDYYPLSDIAAKFGEETGIEKVNSRTVGRMLKRLGVRDKVKRGGKMFYYISSSSLLDLCKRLNVDTSEFPLLSQRTPQTPRTPETPQTLQSILELALRWCALNRVFTVQELAKSLSVGESVAEKIVQLMLKDGKIVRNIDGSYRTT